MKMVRGSFVEPKDTVATPRDAQKPSQEMWVLRERWRRALLMARDPQLTGSELRVLSIALEHASRTQFHEHGQLEFWTGRDTLTALSAHKERSVRKIIDEVAARGVVDLWQAGSRGRGKSAHYVFNNDWLAATEKALGAELLSAWPGAKTLTGENGAYRTDAERKRAPTGPNGTPKRAPAGAMTLEDDPRSKTTPSTRSARGGERVSLARRKGEGTSPDFERFWSGFPYDKKQDATERAKTWRAWTHVLQRHNVAPETIITARDRYVQLIVQHMVERGQNGDQDFEARYRKSPRNFLFDKCWQDGWVDEKKRELDDRLARERRDRAAQVNAQPSPRPKTRPATGPVPRSPVAQRSGIERRQPSPAHDYGIRDEDSPD